MIECPGAGRPTEPLYRFSQAMDAAEPFERQPRLAVAVSGGADSMALCLMAAAWARHRGGDVDAVTVDHRLRRGSGAEADRVGQALRRWGIRHHVLVWDDASRNSASQAAARTARYRLLVDWCRDHGVLHVLTGHNASDQSETVVMRLARGRCVDGLAGIAPMLELSHVRLLRPLLGVSAETVRAWLAAQGQAWIEDPSNEDPRFERVRVRKAMRSCAAAGLTATRLAETAAHAAEVREALEAQVAQVLARTVRLHPAGFAIVAGQAFDAPVEIGRRVLARVLTAVGGRAYPPRGAALDRLFTDLVKEDRCRRATLGRCRTERIGDDILVCREARNLPPPIPVAAGFQSDWDGRFRVSVRPGREAADRAMLVPLGEASAEDCVSVCAAADRNLPRYVFASVPALVDECGLVAAPHLGVRRAGGDVPRFERAAFRPPNTLLGLGYFLA